MAARARHPPRRSLRVPHDRTPPPLPPRIRCPPRPRHPLSSTPCRTDRAPPPSASAYSPSWSSPVGRRRRRVRGRRRASRAHEAGEQISSPTKLIRIASMVRTMLDEVRRAPLDDAGRRRLRGDPREVARGARERAVARPPPGARPTSCSRSTSDTPTESELRLAQAQLVGWLEGLFHGIQATLFTQQAAAQGQLDQMRRRAIDQGPGAPTGPSGYL